MVYGKDNKDFNKRWCEILSKCSVDLMLLIIEDLENNISNLQFLMNSLNDYK